jgi:hypothetical protein
MALDVWLHREPRTAGLPIGLFVRVVLTCLIRNDIDDETVSINSTIQRLIDARVREGTS